MRALVLGLAAIAGLALGCGPKPTQLPEVMQLYVEGYVSVFSPEEGAGTQGLLERRLAECKDPGAEPLRSCANESRDVRAAVEYGQVAEIDLVLAGTQRSIRIAIPKTREGGKVILNLDEGDYPFPWTKVRPCSEKGPPHIKLQLARDDSITAFNLRFCEG